MDGKSIDKMGKTVYKKCIVWTQSKKKKHLSNLEGF